MSHADPVVVVTGVGRFLGARVASRLATDPRVVPEEDNGRVLEQSVAGEEEADEGSKVLLTVGEGPGDVATPNLVGLTYPEAENELERAGLLLGGVSEAPSESVPAGVIVAQEPAAGTTLDPDSYVRLTTSVGPPEVTTYGF